MVEPNDRTDDDVLLIVNYSWATGTPRLRTRSLRARSHLVEAEGFTINYRVAPDARRHCPGRVPFRAGQGDYVDCFNRPQEQGRSCVNCAVAEATLAGSLHHAHTRDPAELDTDVEAHLLQPNNLYLAAFRDGSIKVGTSSAQRTEKRWLEQGAWLAAVVATASDGIVVRRLEDLVTGGLGIGQSVAARRKLSGMSNPVDDEVLAERLKQSAGDVHRLVHDIALPGVDKAEEFWTNPLAGSPLVEGVKSYPAGIDRDSHHFTVKAMVGRLAIITRGGPDNTGPDGNGPDNTGPDGNGPHSTEPDGNGPHSTEPDGNGPDRFVIDIGALIGLELQRGEFQPVELAIQDTLF
ncbi:MAG: DUF2797 domain-containing protein [Acidimicrobiia bacterium]|nr:DUF2797 domain-containing protein [Acidimicrobiia bacterium]